MAALQYKDDHNRIAYLGRERGSEDFTDILSYLDHSPLRYALTHDPPVVFDSLVKQFWATATVRPNAAGSHDLVATIDGREVVVTESLIRTQLHFDDANGIFAMPNSDILEALRLEVGINFQVPLPQPLFVYRLGKVIPLTPPMLAIAAAGNDAADDDDAANEDNAAADEAAGSAAEAPVFPCRDHHWERQPETEWVVPNPVSPGTDWRPWPSVPPPRTPTPPAQTLSFEEPLVFGPVPKPAGYVDPDTIDPIIFGPPPRPYDFVDPALEEPVIFGPLPRPANYIEPEDIDNLNSMEDDTTLGGFHEETHVGPDDAPTTTADAAGRAEDPALLTSLSAKIDRLLWDG
ncbi:hypothetical protein Tco_0494656 [Tanacetum coccineum]